MEHLSLNINQSNLENKKMSYSGSCLCGDVQFKVNTNIQTMYHCHCSLCRNRVVRPRMQQLQFISNILNGHQDMLQFPAIKKRPDFVPIFVNTVAHLYRIR